MIMKTIKNYYTIKTLMLYWYKKQTIIKAIKIIVINSKTKGKEKNPINIDQIDMLVDRWFFLLV